MVLLEEHGQDEENNIDEHHKHEHDESVHEGLQQLGNVEVEVFVVVVEVLFSELLEEHALIEKDQVRNQEGLEHIVEVRNQLEVIDRHIGYELHVLN